MKILMGSHFFSPSVGGIESCSLSLANEFLDAGHQVCILTTSISDNPADDYRFEVLRRPSWTKLQRAVRWCDVFFQNNISVQTAWPLTIIRKPWFVTTATWIGSGESSPGRNGRLKRQILRFAHNLYISEAIAAHVGYPGLVLGNPYDHQTFRLVPDISRNRDLVFLGRLVSDKGCDLMIEAIRQLKSTGRWVTATVIGQGPEEASLMRQVIESGLQDRIHFVGPLSGSPLAVELNRHRVIVIPSRWNEPFGIVALEGMACGCIPVVSAGGGLPEATGGHGFVFPNGDADALADALTQALNATDDIPDFSGHLARFTPASVAKKYLAEFERVVRGTNKNSTA